MDRASLQRYLPGLFASLLLLTSCSAREAALRPDSAGFLLQSIELQVPTTSVHRNNVLELLPLEKGQRVDSTLLSAVRDTFSLRLNQLPGHPFAKLTRWEPEQLANNRIALRFAVDPGPVTVVDSLSFEGLPTAYAENILPLLHTREGEPFEAEQWAADMNRIHQTLLDYGHPFARVVTTPLIPRDRGDTVGVTVGMEVAAGRRIRVERVEVSGLQRTKPRLAERAARLRVGEYYQPERIDAGQRRLLETGWFASVEPGELLRDSEGRFGVLYRVQEGPVGSVSGVLGVAGQDEGIAGALDLRLDNLLGTGRSIGVSWLRDSPSLFSFSASYGEPFLFGTPLSLGLTIEQEAAESSYVALDFAADLGWAVASNWTLTGDLRSRSVSADSLALGADSADYGLVSVGASVEFDSRDRPANPAEGGYYRAYAQRGWTNGGATSVTLDRTELEVQNVFSVRPGWVTFVGLHGVEISSSEGAVPYAEREKIGGAASVRGFVERSLITPRAGWVNLELRRLLGGENRAFLLTDIAVVDSEGRESWKSSWGFGFQVEAGVGVLQVAIAVPSREGYSSAVAHVLAKAVF